MQVGCEESTLAKKLHVEYTQVGQLREHGKIIIISWDHASDFQIGNPLMHHKTTNSV